MNDLTEMFSIEFIKDNFGNFYNRRLNKKNYIITHTILKPGDILAFNVYTAIPSNSINYCFKIGADGHEHCQSEPSKEFIIAENHIRDSIAVYIKVCNPIGITGGELFPNVVEFRYTVLPL